MNQEITASYVFTVDELIRSRENHQRAQCRPIFRTGLIFLSLMAILAGWFYYQEKGWAIFTFLFPLGGIYFLFLRKYDTRWTTIRHFKKRPDKDSHVVWNLGEETIQVRTTESETKQNWSLITKVRKASNGFLLYLNDRMFYWLPFSAFSNEDDLIGAEELLRRKVNDFENIR